MGAGLAKKKQANRKIKCLTAQNGKQAANTQQPTEMAQNFWSFLGLCVFG